MSTRYTRLFSLPLNLYAEGMPVIIAAGALLKDEQTGNVLAQLKYQSISTKKIKALKVCISPLDTVGNPLGEPTHFQYLDLTVSRDRTFGDKTPVFLPDATTRAFTAYVEEVIFQDNSVWSSGAQDLSSLHTPTPLSSVSDLELVRQFRMEYGDGCKNLPLDDKDLWNCVCGAVNHREEAACRMCGNLHATLQAISMDDLRKRKDERLAHEQKLAQEEAERRAKEAEQQKAAAKATAKKAVKIAIPLAAVLAVILLVTQVIIPASRYSKAVALMEAGQYEEAISAFEAMEGYKDSTIQITACETAIKDSKYSNAVTLMEAGQYEEAATILEALGNYSYAKVQLAECNNALAYAEAERLESSGETAKAAIAFGKLGDYKDAHERSFGLWDKVANRETISAGPFHCVVLLDDGTVKVTSYSSINQSSKMFDVSGWRDIIAVDSGEDMTVGLKSDGTVNIAHDDAKFHDVLSKWKDIVAVSCGGGHIVGLKKDGTVVSYGTWSAVYYDLDDWTDIVRIYTDSYCTVGIKSDGTICVKGDSEYSILNCSSWTDIVDISTETRAVWGLMSDGTVVSTEYEQNELFDNTDIIDIACNYGLKSDGTVVNLLTGEKYSWKNILSVSTVNQVYRWPVLIALKGDGTLVATRWNPRGQTVYLNEKDNSTEQIISTWTDIKIPN